MKKRIEEIDVQIKRNDKTPAKPTLWVTVVRGRVDDPNPVISSYPVFPFRDDYQSRFGKHYQRALAMQRRLIPTDFERHEQAYFINGEVDYASDGDGQELESIF